MWRKKGLLTAPLTSCVPKRLFLKFVVMRIKMRNTFYLLLMLLVFALSFALFAGWYYHSPLGSMINHYFTRFDSFAPKKRSKQPNTYQSCKGPWVKWYEQFHAQSLLKRKATDQTRTRFLVYLCNGQRQGCGGLGNRINGIVSLFYLAVLTNRVFMIHWGGPGKLEDFLQPNKISWIYDERLLRGFKMNRIYWGVSGPPRGYHDSRIEVYSKFLNWTQHEDFEVLLSQDVKAGVGTIWYFADQIWKNPHLSKRAKELGLPTAQSGFPFAMLGCAMDFLFKKSAPLENKLRQARKSLTVRPYIGIHIRTNDHHFGDPNPYSIRTKNPGAFLECAKRAQNLTQAKKRVLGKHPMTWFLATDDVKLKEKWMMEKLPSKLFSLKITPKHLEYSLSDTASILDMLTDIFLLSESDYLIISFDSTFSYVAMGIRGFSTKSFTYGQHCLIDETNFEFAD